LVACAEKSRRENAKSFYFRPDFNASLPRRLARFEKYKHRQWRRGGGEGKEKRWKWKFCAPRTLQKVADFGRMLFSMALSEEEYLAAAKEILVVAKEGADRLRRRQCTTHQGTGQLTFTGNRISRSFSSEDGSHKRYGL